MARQWVRPTPSCWRQSIPSIFFSRAISPSLGTGGSPSGSNPGCTVANEKSPNQNHPRSLEYPTIGRVSTSVVEEN
ncbi:hypothetical protein J6590_096067 [Homalodisca vitripennis]|nr:hypothetical protein J6590_096067 [Homalodisca vitripennis]